MEKVEAPTLEEAYQKASEVLACSVSQLESKVVQYPSKGILGFFKKSAIIVAIKNDTSPVVSSGSLEQANVVASEIIATLKEEAFVAQLEEPSNIEQPPATVKKREPTPTFIDDEVVDSFFETDRRGEADEREVDPTTLLAREIEKELKALLALSCFNLDIVEVDVEENRAFIFIDGDDAALLIGKEGYRYNALSYMIFNWLHAKYKLFIKLEIAAFLTTQEQMIRNYIKPVIESVHQHGRGKTAPLDGILVQIALEQLREAFSDKYVGVKTLPNGKKFIVVNAFNSKKKHAS